MLTRKGIILVIVMVPNWASLLPNTSQSQQHRPGLKKDTITDPVAAISRNAVLVYLCTLLAHDNWCSPFHCWSYTFFAPLKLWSEIFVFLKLR